MNQVIQEYLHFLEERKVSFLYFWKQNLFKTIEVY